MMILLVATSTTLLCFLSITACLRFVFSRQGWFWIIPLILSVVFFYISIDPLVQVLTGIATDTYRVTISPDRSVREIVPLIIVLLWYTMIIVFRYALKSVVPVNQQLIDTKKNLYESRYMEKVELKRMRRKAKRQLDAVTSSSRQESGTLYPLEWVERFDE
ncbi:MAG: hypothetical protein WDA14_09055 [Sphaerochaetaceae bacterium]|jgi:hypothetical protein|nr:hypothetical protein [Sphaerochaetaceae bacterium]MDD4259409.1 hypothetical protein [Sphaerochaetaceae bacterium]MDD4762850.1 hypothetical protein [Sphaerochaetaceae bacterium]MDX9933474.1 hypothetical protein [Sphaerochaetaceae bacterium]NLO61514.1 hypothetical protein [Spirochaetales bacterium]